MKKVAKLVIVDADGQYLLLYRNNHPRFGNDPDLPGGTVEDGESTLVAMIREVREEIGVTIKPDVAHEVRTSLEYSKNSTYYSLYFTQLTNRPKINLSWEHSSYEWVTRDEFIDIAKNAKDTYMKMVYDAVNQVNLE